MRYIYSLLLLSYSCLLWAQLTYSVASIPDSLRENSTAVVRNELTQITLEQPNKMRIYNEKVVSVLESSADSQAVLSILYNDYTHIKNYAYEIYDAQGNLIKKLKKKDFKDYSAVSGATMYSDYRVLLSDFRPNTYPYTVKYVYEILTENTIFVPSWTPIEGERIAVEKSEYTFVNKTEVSMEMSMEIPEGFDVKKETKTNYYHFSLAEQTPILLEPSCPAWDSLVPVVRLAPHTFYLSGERGNFINWQELGFWMFHQLIKDTRELPKEEITYVKNLVKEAPSDREKVRLIYEYLQNKTRYISIQIGIGGWKPFPAKHVSENSYGDCKGLSNYFVSLLEAVGIEGNYTVVYGTRKNIRNIDPNFASIQGNHVIVNVPMQADTLWLECTSQETAFNHLGKFTHDRYALSVNEKGGEIVKTQHYGAEDNWAKHEAYVSISPEGKLHANSVSKLTGLLYDQLTPFKYLDKTYSKEYLYSLFGDLSSLEVKEYNYTNHKEKAVGELSMSVDGRDFGQIIGDNMIFRALPIFGITHEYKKDYTRKYPLVLESPKSNYVKIVFEIPPGYTLKQIPEEITFKSDFGSYRLSYSMDNQHIIVKREFHSTSGTFAPKKYNEYVSFLQKVEKADHSKLLIEKP